MIFMIAQTTTKLISKEVVAENTYRFIFEKPDSFDFVAGQYVFLDFANPKNTDDRPSMRALSIASAPQEDHLMFIMRGSESAFKKNITSMEPGEEIAVKGPMGHVALPDNIHQSIVLIVAGVGITPARAMIKHEEIVKSPRPVTLIYSNREKKCIAIKEEMDNMQLENYKVVHTLTREEGEWDGERSRIDAAMIERNIDDIKNHVYYVVGTGKFVEAVQKILCEELGIDKLNVHFDNFG